MIFIKTGVKEHSKQLWWPFFFAQILVSRKIYFKPVGGTFCWGNKNMVSSRLQQIERISVLPDWLIFTIAIKWHQWKWLRVFHNSGIDIVSIGCVEHNLSKAVLLFWNAQIEKTQPATHFMILLDVDVKAVRLPNRASSNPKLWKKRAASRVLATATSYHTRHRTTIIFPFLFLFMLNLA